MSAVLETPVRTPSPVAAIRVRLATLARDIDAARALRRAVFCAEQGLFDGDDVDPIDAHALPIAAVDEASGTLLGTVRIHQGEPGIWHGSRLAVARGARGQSAIGTGLIRMAVGSAHARGCHTFLAQVQRQNVALFQRLHWQSLAEITLHGVPHHLMRADLAFYPPIADGAAGFLLNGGAPCKP